MTTSHEGRTFDVQPSQDPRSADHRMRPVLMSVGEPDRRRVCHRRGTVLDQGREGACVGHGVVGDLIGTPVRVKFSTRNTVPLTLPNWPQPASAQAAAFWFYRYAKTIDEFAGTEYDGTSLNAGMKVARDTGFIDGWRWCDSREDFRSSVQQFGPVVITVPWHEGMYDAPGGELTVSGKQVGWHCILVNGYDPALRTDTTLREPREDGRREMFRLLNSWGSDWGTGGQAWIDADALWSLIDDNGGEMAVSLGRHAKPGA